MNNKFIYFSYLYGIEKNTSPTVVVNKEDSALIVTKETFNTYKDINKMHVKGFIYKGERDIKDTKETAICVYKDGDKLMCQFIKIKNSIGDKFNIQELFTFEVNDNYEVKNKYLVFIDYFYVKNKITNKIEFELYYYHPYNRTLFYDGMFEDMRFKELEENFNKTKWKNELLSRFVD